jgi:hypothetical protein
MGFLRSNANAQKTGEEVFELDLVATETAMDTGVNGLAAHQETVLTPEERHAEKRFRLKIDFMILPLIATIYFLAALASLTRLSPTRPTRRDKIVELEDIQLTLQTGSK